MATKLQLLRPARPLVAALLALVAFRPAPGPSTRQTREVAAFAEVQLSTSVTVVVRQGSPQQVVVEAASEDLPKLQTEVVAGKLRIERVRPGTHGGLLSGWDDKASQLAGPATVYVTLPTVRGLAVSSSGRLEAESIEGQRVRLAVSGSGQLRVAQLQAAQVRASLSSSGQVAVQQLRADTLEASVSGSGSLVAAGTCAYSDLGLSSSGRLDATSLAVQSCQARLSGSGSCLVNVARTLDARLSGSGSLLVSGNPQINSRVSGSGRVRQR